MKSLTTLVVAVAAAVLSGCVVAPSRGYDRDHHDNQYRQGRHHDGYGYRHDRDSRWRDGDHAGGTGTPD